MATGGHQLQGRRRAAVAVLPHLVDPGRGYASPNHIIDAIRQALVVLDEKLCVVSANRAFYRTFAVTSRDSIGRHLADVGAHCLDVPALDGFLALLQAEDSAIEDYEIVMDLPVLGRRVLLLTAGKIRADLGATCEIVVTIDDVTERKRAEATLKSAKWHAERANLSKSRFLAAASHDLRQPLQALSLVRGILAKKIKDKENEEALKLLGRLNETADALLGMLDTLLDVNQLKAGSVRPEKVNFPINDLLERLRIEFAYHAQAHGLIWRVVSCRLIIWTDPRLLEQMIRNLLSNAVKHTERGKILLGCRRRGDKLRVEVWDTGAGITEGQLHAIFEEYHQLDNPIAEHARGFGVGLSIVRRLAILLGHSVDIQSRPGKGSVFAVETTLGGEQPAARQDSPPGDRRRARSSRPRDPAVILTDDISPDTMRAITHGGCVQRGKPVRAEKLSHLTRSLLAESPQPRVRSDPCPQVELNGDILRPTIFLVDDESSVREAMCGLLQEDGWAVEVYSSGETFLEAHRPGREGCLVVDARMPNMNGLELLERLKTEGGGLPAIIISGHADIRLAVRAMKAGAIAFLEKPVQYDELVINIERALELTRNSAALSSLREVAATRIASLTIRERQVVKMVVEGNPNKQIAYVIGISQRTVETHRATAMKKVGARTLSELIHLTIAGSTHDT
jgi:FixJ family two-component response regulator/signal transduction histidine kinase